MKNLTLAVDEDVLNRVRVVAASRRTSVNAMVRAYLAEIAEREDRAAQARANLRVLSERSTARIGIQTWTRESLHER
jgi:hypothetical protein